jgi:hypothetical protein
MGVYWVDCETCHGRPIERLEERTADGEWQHNTMLDAAIADAWLAADPWAPIRWQEVPCPQCAGRGSYEVESTACRIF